MVGCHRCTCRCQHCRCMCWLTTWNTAVQCATSRSHGHGCYKGTCAPTRERNRSAARTAAKRSPTGPTYARTCRRTRHSSCTRASAVESLLHWKLTSTSTTSRHVSATMVAWRLEKSCHRQLTVTKIHDLAWRVSGVYENIRCTDLSESTQSRLVHSIFGKLFAIPESVDMEDWH